MEREVFRDRESAIFVPFRDYFKHLETHAKGHSYLYWGVDGTGGRMEQLPLRATRFFFEMPQRTKRLVEKLDPLGEIVSAEEREEMSRALVLYAEHTFGFSHTRLWNMLYQQLFLRKSLLAIKADELAGAALVKVFKHHGEHAFRG